MGDGSADFLSAENRVAIEGAGVAFLTAHFGKEDGLVGDDEVAVNFEDGGFTGVLVKADEFGDGVGGDIGGADNSGLLGSSREFTGFFHAGLDGGFIEGDATLAAEEGSEVDGEAESVVKLEGFFGWEGFSSCLLYTSDAADE